VLPGFFGISDALRFPDWPSPFLGDVRVASPPAQSRFCARFLPRTRLLPPSRPAAVLPSNKECCFCKIIKSMHRSGQRKQSGFRLPRPPPPAFAQAVACQTTTLPFGRHNTIGSIGRRLRICSTAIESIRDRYRNRCRPDSHAVRLACLKFRFVSSPLNCKFATVGVFTQSEQLRLWVLVVRGDARVNSNRRRLLQDDPVPSTRVCSWQRTVPVGWSFRRFTIERIDPPLLHQLNIRAAQSQRIGPKQRHDHALAAPAAFRSSYDGESSNTQDHTKRMAFIKPW
jgi:hypothetical protein